MLPIMQRLPALPPGFGTKPCVWPTRKNANEFVGSDDATSVRSLSATNADPVALMTPVAPVLLATAEQ